MKRYAIALMVVLSALPLLACGGSALPATPTTDLQATVDAAVVATAIAATATAQASTPEPTVETAALSADELAAEIEAAVAQATASAQQCSEATTVATADGAITAEETEALETQTAEANADLAYAEALIESYYELYGDMAEETMALLEAMEDDLSAIADQLTALDASLAEIADALAQGVALADETITQLEEAAQSVSALVQEAQAQAQAQEWRAALQEELQGRAEEVLAVLPTEIPDDRQAAVAAAFDYVDGVRQALEDGRVSQEELQRIAQLGANAGAGIEAHGGPQLQRFATSIDEITAHLALGELPQAKTALGNLETGLGSRPSRP